MSSLCSGSFCEGVLDRFAVGPVYLKLCVLRGLVLDERWKVLAVQPGPQKVQLHAEANHRHVTDRAASSTLESVHGNLAVLKAFRAKLVVDPACQPNDATPPLRPADLVLVRSSYVLV